MRSMFALVAAVAAIFCATTAKAEQAALAKRHLDPVWVAQEKRCLAYTVEVEAGGEPFEGKLMVAWVAVKRADDATTPERVGSVCEAVNKKTIKGGKVVSEFQAPKRGRKVVVSTDSYIATELVFAGDFVPDPSFIPIRFLYNPVESDPKRAAWFRRELLCPLVIKNHTFCLKPAAKKIPLPRPRPVKPGWIV